MIPPFKQTIKAGNVGLDVLAVKRAVKKMKAQDAEKIVLGRRAGPNLIHTFRAIEHNRRMPVDGIYGPKLHAIVAPFFDRRGRVLYALAKKRKPMPPPPPTGSAQAEAKLLLQYHAEGKYRADNPGDLYDIERTAQGAAVWSQCGYWVHVDPRPLRLLVWLIGQGYRIGTFAVCSDHHCDGPHGHSGGFAVDISSINGVSIASNSYTARELTLEVARKINHAPNLRPRQQICDGAGYEHVPAISDCTIPGAWFYGYSTMSEHRNHIHCGY